MNTNELKSIIEQDENCLIIKSLDNDSKRPVFNVSKTIKETGNKTLISLFPDFLNQINFIETVYEIISNHYFDDIESLITYIKMLKTNSHSNYLSCLHKDEKDIMYFNVLDDFWEKFTITVSNNSENSIPLSKIKSFQSFHPNQKIYLNPLQVLSEEEEKLLDKEGLLVRLYDFEN